MFRSACHFGSLVLLLVACGGRPVGDGADEETGEGTTSIGTTSEDTTSEGAADDGADAETTGDSEGGGDVCEPGPGEGECEAHGDASVSWSLETDSFPLWEADELNCVVENITQVVEPTYTAVAVAMDCGVELRVSFGGVEPELPFAEGMSVVVSAVYRMYAEVPDLWLRITDDGGTLLFGGVNSAELEAPDRFAWTTEALSLGAIGELCPGQWHQGDCFVLERMRLELSAGEQTARAFDGGSAMLGDESYRLIVGEARRVNCYNEASEDPSGCGVNSSPTRYVAAVISNG